MEKEPCLQPKVTNQEKKVILESFNFHLCKYNFF